MVALINSRIWEAITLLITIFSLCLPAYAKYSGGIGEPNDPYQIATAEDLMLLGDSPEDYDKHFILTTDIDMNPNLPGCKVFDRAVIAPDTDPNKVDFDGIVFTGVFDGDGHTISHLTITGGGQLGLFGALSWAEVRHLGIIDVNVVGSGYDVGGLTGLNSGIVSQCYSTGVICGGSYVGALAGHNGGTVSQCYSNGTVTGDSDVGGLVGYSIGPVSYCYSTSTVNGNRDVGGLIGGMMSIVS